MKLLHLLPTLDPAGGGPMEGVLQSSLACIGLGHTVEVATLDDPAAPFLRGYPLRVHALGPARSGYGYSSRYVPWLRAHAEGYDAVIVNGLWQYHGLGAWRALRRARVPYFVFTHGMLDPWFKTAYPLKHAKKWLYWPWADYRLLRDARGVLFTCEEERLLARQSFWLYRAREIVVSFGTRAPPTDAPRLREAFFAAHPDLRGRRLLLFLSRIHEKKGCDLLLDAFARVATEQPDLHLVIAGPDQTGWQAALQARAAALGIGARVSWPGMLQGDLKWGAFHAAEAYVLPSHQENFGIAVAEALGCGVPVLISDKVNIWREIEAAGAGVIDTDTADGCERMLRRWLALSAPQREAMRAAASALFVERFTVEAMAASLIALVEGQGVTASPGAAVQPG
jgi:glycosyltransferase involved in cell wall biosynthesis